MEKIKKNNEKYFIRTVKFKMVSQNAEFLVNKTRKIELFKIYDVRKNEKRKNNSQKGKKTKNYEMNEGNEVKYS